MSPISARSVTARTGPTPVIAVKATAIGSPAADNALAELLGHIPPDAKLWLADRADVDMALVAEVLLAADRNLEPYQREALARFIALERERTRSEIAARYSDRDAGFERFRAQLIGPDKHES